MSKFLRNVWYVAAWSHELVGDAFLARTLLDQPVLLYRTHTGEAVAIGNRCPHRFAPLNLGKRFGDVVACPYHGLRFDRTGACVHNPQGDGRIPTKAKVPGYPVVERVGLLWIWMGDAGAADATLVPDLNFLADPNLTVIAPDRLTLGCNYELAADNLMDLSHAVFIHENTFGTPDALKGKLSVHQEGNHVHADIWVPSCMPAGAAIPLEGPGRPVDHWLDMQWSPAGNMVLKVGTTRCGRPREDGFELLSPNLLTPETQISTHYFFAGALPKAAAAQGDGGRPSARYVFENEDEPILRAVQKMMGSSDLWSMEPVLLASDAGAVRVRRVLQGLIEAEARRADAAAE